jgi:hypothetical protein
MTTEELKLNAKKAKAAANTAYDDFMKAKNASHAKVATTPYGVFMNAKNVSHAKAAANTAYDDFMKAKNASYSACMHYAFSLAKDIIGDKPVSVNYRGKWRVVELVAPVLNQASHIYDSLSGKFIVRDVETGSEFQVYTFDLSLDCKNHIKIPMIHSF